MKIAMLGLHHDTNNGDPLICQTVKYLYEQNLPKTVEWYDVDLNKRRYFDELPNTLIVKTSRKLFGFSQKLSKNNKIGDYFKYFDVILLSWAFRSIIKNIDAGIIAGGGIIHYKVHDYAICISAFIRACKIKSIPVVVNGVGIEGFCSENVKCRLLQKYLNYENVKFISTRDDLSLLKTKYIRFENIKNKILIKVPDPAIFSSKAFGIQKNKASETIGIGLIRGSIFHDYKVDYSPKQIVDYYSNIVKIFKSGGGEI